MTIRFLPRAQRDLVAIRDWGDVRWGQGRTDDYVRGLTTAIERLGRHPYLGRSRDAILPDLRSIRYEAYIVFYKIDDDDVLVGAILHERRNHAALDFADRFQEG